MIKVAVLGALGRMGSEVCRAVDDDDDLELVAKVDEDDSLDVLIEAGAQVAVDFTTPSSVKENIKWCMDNGIHAVVGTTGLTEHDLADINGWARSGDANCFVAPNFALGAVLMMSFAAQAAPYFATAEIIERHHEKKIDAPSGTALRTARLMNDSRQEPWAAPSEEKETVGHVRGGMVDGLRIHSLRVPGSVAHQEVVLGAHGETLTIRHDSLERASFMPGVMLAVKKVGSLDGLTVGLEQLLDL
jgi:4-hydroxy-tetrahydrodipicolinate reductase